MLTVDMVIKRPLAEPLPIRASVTFPLNPIEHVALLDKARTTPEFHLAVASSSAMFEYRRAIEQLTREFSSVKEAFTVLKKRGAKTELEREFLAKYEGVCNLIW
jgi:hypothetical protein